MLKHIHDLQLLISNVVCVEKDELLEILKIDKAIILLRKTS